MFIGALTATPAFLLPLLSWLGWTPNPELDVAPSIATTVAPDVHGSPSGRTSPIGCAEGWRPTERIVPAFAQGTAVGFKVLRIRPGSLLANAGLRDGDIVRTVNGLDLMAPEKSLRLYSSLKGRTLLRLDILRDGQPWVVHYRSPEPLFSPAWYQQACGASPAAESPRG